MGSALHRHRGVWGVGCGCVFLVLWGTVQRESHTELLLCMAKSISKRSSAFFSCKISFTGKGMNIARVRDDQAACNRNVGLLLRNYARNKLFKKNNNFSSGLHV